MKIWVKLVIGSVFGLVLGFLLPENHPDILNIFEFLREFVIGVGRYTAVPAVVFSLTIAIYELRQDGKFLPLVLRTFLVIALVSVFLIALGIGVTMLFPPERIPILIEHQSEEIFFSPTRDLLDIFPSNMFAVFSGGGVYIFPLCVLSFFLALGLRYDRNYTKQVIALIDSMSRIIFYIASFFSELMGLLIIALAAFWAVRYRQTLNAGVFMSIIRMLLIYALILTFVVLPMFLFFIRRVKNPWKKTYGCLGPAIAAFFSGDYNFCIPVLITHMKENLGIRRRSALVTFSLFSTFGKSGSAMVACMSFIVIVQSYSSLGISGSGLISIGLTAFVLSFLLARNSSDAAFIALALLCSNYGHGFEAGYLILKPIAFYLISIGTFIDIVITALGSFAIAGLNNFADEKPAARFI
ncbi:MAG: dicarboxylate/amino acid:cation symporter [Spirochaetaceae bacterium]|jgi:Na+/H+-dicarboxylate symporter|nr:dicarboxylate/amino acid:cation symporter [Spirochaetaceae bacterium]